MLQKSLINRKDYPFWRDSFDFIPIFEIQKVWKSSFYVGFFPTSIDRNMDHEFETQFNKIKNQIEPATTWPIEVMLCQSRNIFSPFHFLIYVAKEVASSEASLMQYVCIELKENLSKKKKASLCAPGKGARRLRLAAVAVCSGGDGGGSYLTTEFLRG